MTDDEEIVSLAEISEDATRWECLLCGTMWINAAETDVLNHPCVFRPKSVSRRPETLPVSAEDA